jgi:hypothetical protein
VSHSCRKREKKIIEAAKNCAVIVSNKQENDSTTKRSKIDENDIKIENQQLKYQN